MRQGFVLKKGKKFVRLNSCGYTKLIDRAEIYTSERNARDDVVDDEEMPIRVTITVKEEKS